MEDRKNKYVDPESGAVRGSLKIKWILVLVGVVALLFYSSGLNGILSSLEKAKIIRGEGSKKEQTHGGEKMEGFTLKHVYVQRLPKEKDLEKFIEQQVLEEMKTKGLEGKVGRIDIEEAKRQYRIEKMEEYYNVRRYDMDEKDDVNTSNQEGYTMETVKKYGRSDINTLNTVSARAGIAKELEKMRQKYLASKHGIQKSYWKTEIKKKTVDWDYVVDDGLLVPNTRDKETILSLARMAANAYNSIDGDEWEDLGEPWKNKTAIGWESDGLRGHVFATQDNKTLVLSIKGTSASLFLVGRGPTSVKDKFNDNRMFSCCCARVDYSWSTVCDCYMGSNQCDERCLQNSMSIAEDLYFYTAAMLIMDLTNRYPDSQIVLTGHSLGGSLAALMGLSFGLPVVAFEAPGDLLAAKRLHLPMPPAIDFATLPIYHVGHDADPIFTGTCTGASSSCYYAGYALETKCHLGNSCMLGVAEKLNWRLDIRHHRITEVIEHVLLPWDRITNSTSLPECKPEVDCVDCGLWQYV